MAEAVIQESGRRIDQALHGYAEGHRQLATSAKLTPRDTKALLMLSDISGPGVRLEEGGYLTGYPLAESGVFALARTWPASEMPRPGCVWTHTLLIDFADLASIRNPVALASLFRRPNVSAYSDYAKPLIYTDQPMAAPLMPNEAEWARHLVSGLYAKARQRTVATRPSNIDADALTLSIWGQQWPRLRRSFRFCTWSAADRSTEGAPFDLQLLSPTDRSLRSRFQGVADIDTFVVSANDWIDDVVADLIQPDVMGLRTFLHRIGSQVTHGREAFAPLSRFHHLMQGAEHEPSALTAAAAILDNEFASDEVRGARAMVVAAALSRVHEIDESLFNFLQGNLDLAEATALDEHAADLGCSIWKRSPADLLPFFETDQAFRIIPERAIAHLHPNDLLSGIKRLPELIPFVLKLRPEVATLTAFWRLEGLDCLAALNFLVQLGDDHAQCTLHAIIEAGCTDLAFDCVRHFGGLPVLEAATSSHGLEGDQLGSWVKAAAQDIDAVAQCLSEERPLTKKFLLSLAMALHPDAVPNEFGDDPWCLGMRFATGELGMIDQVYLCTYLLCRAFGPSTRNCAELARLGFETAYRAAERSELPDYLWRLLEKRTPWSIWWLDWDRCPRLRAGVVELFVDRQLDPIVFADLVTDDELFLRLAEQACDTARGRRLMEGVYSAINEHRSSRFWRRTQILQKLLRIKG